MLSNNCDIREFISELENKDFFEMIYMLDMEATKVERQLFNSKTEKSDWRISGSEYVNNLKDLVSYLIHISMP